MSELSFRKAAALSLAFHMVLVLTAALVSKRASDRNPDIYTVKLVTQKPAPSPRRVPPPKRQDRRKATPEPLNRQKVQPKEKKSDAAKPEAAPREDLMAIKREKAESLRRLKAEQVEKQKDEKLRAIEDRLKAQRLREVAEARAREAEETLLSEGRRSKVLDEYKKSIHDRIKELWVFPDIGISGLEAVISITVKRSGTIVINRFEKPSGSAVFDQSALKAIQRAGKVEPPPFGEDMEIGLIFSPDEG